MQRVMLAYAQAGFGTGLATVGDRLVAQAPRLIRVGAGRMLRSFLFALVWSYVTSVVPHAFGAHLKSPSAALAAVITAELTR